MRIIRTELAHAYDTYSFGYTVHAVREKGDTPADAYDSGYLPASNDPAVTDRFYMARSTRVPLARFASSSENRRILKKFDGKFETTLLARDELSSDEAFAHCFLSYFADRHGQGVMGAERLAGILATPLPLRGVRYSQDGVPAGYVLEVADESFAHYWYSCYDLSYAGTSLGMWLMLDGVRRAQDEGRTYCYLGTAYGEKGRYKMNIAPLEFWNGNAWTEDTPLLKELVASDSGRELRR